MLLVKTCQDTLALVAQSKSYYCHLNLKHSNMTISTKHVERYSSSPFIMSWFGLNYHPGTSLFKTAGEYFIV